MTMFACILLPLDGSATAASGLGCAAWLASRLGVRLHVLSATPRELPAPEELRRLRVPESHWPMLELHQVPAHPVEAILSAAAQRGTPLVVMTARGAAIEPEAGHAPADLAKITGHVTHAVMERIHAPLLLLPAGYREVLPWRTLLVPVSGGTESDQAVALSVRMAHAMDLSVHVAHVVGDGARTDEELAPRTRYCDELHHEYAAQLEELVARALPTVARHECRRIRSLALIRGETAPELMRLVRRHEISALVLGWHGRLGGGRAAVLEDLLVGLDVPVFLVRSEPAAAFRLEVGEELG